jgi:lysophospholipid acyltransferase (LPLAT)-like uncharacterized protein
VRRAARRRRASEADGAADRPTHLCRLKKKLFRSWDRFEVPLPFSRACFAWGEPIWVPRDGDRVLLEAKRVEVEAALNKLGDEADHSVEDVTR